MRPEVKMGLSLLRATGSKLGTHAPVYLSVPAVWRCHTEEYLGRVPHMGRVQVGMWPLGPAEMSSRILCPLNLSLQSPPVRTVGYKRSYHVDFGSRTQKC